MRFSIIRMKLLAAVVFCVFAHGQEIKEVQNSLTVSMYFEGDCPDCHVYMREQLVKAWEGPFDQSNQTLLDLVPFGNAEQRLENGRWIFKCQHGREECLHNKLYACAIRQACGGVSTAGCKRDKVDQVLRYILCVTQQEDQVEATAQCTSELGDLTAQYIRQCARSEEGSQLLSQYGSRTAACDPAVDYVPWININGDHDTAAEENLVYRIYELKPELRLNETAPNSS